MFGYDTVENGYVIYQDGQLLAGYEVRKLLNELNLDHELPRDQMKIMDSKVILNGQPFEYFEIQMPMGDISFKGIRSVAELPSICIYDNEEMIYPVRVYQFDKKNMSHYFINDVSTTIIINAV